MGAKPRTEKVPCQRCGKKFERPIGVGGRPALNCPEHRKKRGKPADPKAANERRNAVRKKKKAATRAAEEPGPEMQRNACLLAVGLGYHKSARAAARSVGLDLGSAELRQTEAIARASYPDLSGKDPREGTAALINQALGMLAYHTVSNAHLISPRDLPTATRQLAQVRELIGGDKGHNFTEIVVNIPGLTEPPPDGDG